MRHRPASAPRPTRRGVRLALGALVSTVLTGLVLSAPVVSGATGRTPFVALDSFAATSAAGSTTDGDSPVVMGLDGAPSTSSTDAFAGSASPAPTPSTPSATSATSVTSAAPAPTTTDPTPAPELAPAAAVEAPAPVAAAEPADPSAEGQVLALVNVQRAAAGCGALTADPALAGLARAHSADMRDRHFFDHVNPDGLDPFDRAARAGLVAHAENIAYGQPDPAAVMDAWMNSAGHRANILDCDLTRLGVGVAEGPGGPWWTQDFA